MASEAAKRLPNEAMPSEPDPGSKVITFKDCIARLRDGREYTFTTPGLTGYFHKAPFPARDRFTDRDGACSAITYRDKKTSERASPTMLLDELDSENGGGEAGWVISPGPWRG